MFGLGFGELIVIFLIALIFIGPKKLPELAKGLGKGIKQFQDAAKGLSDQLQNPDDSSSQTSAKIADATRQDEIIPAASPPAGAPVDDKDKPQT